MTSGSVGLSHFCRVQLFGTPWTVAHQSPLSMEFTKQEHWSGCFPSPRDLPDPGIDLGLLHCGQILYHLSHQGSPRSLIHTDNKTCAFALSIQGEAGLRGTSVSGYWIGSRTRVKPGSSEKCHHQCSKETGLWRQGEANKEARVRRGNYKKEEQLALSWLLLICDSERAQCPSTKRAVPPSLSYKDTRKMENRHRPMRAMEHFIGKKPRATGSAVQ